MVGDGAAVLIDHGECVRRGLVGDHGRIALIDHTARTLGVCAVTWLLSRGNRRWRRNIVHHARHGTGQVAGNPSRGACASHRCLCSCKGRLHGGRAAQGGGRSRSGEARTNHQSSGLHRALNARLQRSRRAAHSLHDRARDEWHGQVKENGESSWCLEESIGTRLANVTKGLRREAAAEAAAQKEQAEIEESRRRKKEAALQAAEAEKELDKKLKESFGY